MSKYTLKTATISSGTGVSDDVNMEHFRLAAIAMPSAWTSATITFAASNDGGTTWLDVYDDDGNEVALTVDASRYVAIDTNALIFLPAIDRLRVQSGTSGTVNQGADRELTLVCIRD